MMGMDPFYQLELAERYLDEGEAERARQLVLIYIDEVPLDAEICFRWAKICEELGMARQAMKFYIKAMRSGKASAQILFNYALLLNDIGHYEDCIHYLKKAIKMDPQHEGARKLLSDAYKALGLFGQAEVLSRQPEEKKAAVRYFPPTVSDEHIKRILSLFSGREVGYAVQSLDRFTSDPEYKFQNAPLSHELISRHVKGEVTLAVYPVRMDKTVKYAAISIRIRSRVLRENIKNAGYLKYLEEKALGYGLSLKRRAEGADIPAYVDSSGGFSFRVWFFFRDFVHFLKVRRFLKEFMEDTAPPETHIEVDPYIGTRGVGIGWIEHPVLLPFGVNLATKRRSLFLNDEGSPVPDQLLFLKKIEEIPFEDSFKSIKGAKVSNHQVPMQSFPVTIKDMVDSCSILREIINKARSARILSREEKVILFYTVGILDENGSVLHSILNPCPDYNYTKVERQRVRLKQNPISCIKIREYLPDLTASLSCNCIFDLRGGRYPSPVMHINPYMVPPREELVISDETPLKDLARRYISLKRQRAEIDRAIEKAIRLFEKYYKRTGRESIYVDGAFINRIRDGENIIWEPDKR